MKKIVQIPLTDEESMNVLILTKIIQMSKDIIDKIERLPAYQGETGGISRWTRSALDDAIGMKNLAKKELGELLCKIHLERGKVL